MPWSELSTMDHRTAFIKDWLRDGNVTALAVRYEVSRKTAYKWIARFTSGGKRALADASRRPLTCPHATPPEVAEALIELRKEHPTWGAKKLVAKLAAVSPTMPLPAVSTASEIIDRAGLVRERRQRRRLPQIGGAWPRGDRPNAIWCADYKGQFRTLDGRWCYPLTVTDEYSRLVLECRGYGGIDSDQAHTCFERLFRRHGLPEAIRSDNGAPFASTGLCRLSRLAVWWMRLGIALKRNLPGHPEHNGRHERMHRDLKAETTRPPAADLRAQQRRFDAFIEGHNRDRPHEALDQQTPSQHYVDSPRPYPERLPVPEYPSHYEKRLVTANGCISLWGKYVFLSHALYGQWLGLIEKDEDRWAVHFGSLQIAVIDRRTGRASDAIEDGDSDVLDACTGVA
jgi:putative transposase